MTNQPSTVFLLELCDGDIDVDDTKVGVFPTAQAAHDWMEQFKTIKVFTYNVVGSWRKYRLLCGTLEEARTKYPHLTLTEHGPGYRVFLPGTVIDCEHYEVTALSVFGN
jgi:hypothetical protein